MYERADYLNNFDASLLYSAKHRFHPSASSFKHVIDVVGAFIGLCLSIVLSIPILVAIVLDSPGPVLYCQEQCGLRDKRFYLRKFRSMVRNDANQLKSQVKNEAKELIFKNRRDPRVTRIRNQ